MKSLHQKLKRYGFFALAVFLIILLLLPIARSAIARMQAPHPQIILTLGGGPEREEFTAQFAQNHPTLDIWVSSGIPAEQAYTIFKAANIPEERIHLDYRAIDTVTNFTTLVADFEQRGIQHLYLITSEEHITRAKAIATIVLGSQGITFTPVSFISKFPSEESIFRVIRDCGRALFWVVTGRTGASLNPRVSSLSRK
jgi:uncharacterized SAM-binding protein YcdF (DUF218 family)